MANFTGTYIPIGQSLDARVNTIVDTLLTPKIIPYRQVIIYDERGTLQNDGATWNLTYGNWLPDYVIQVHLNNALVPSSD